jgi:uncharacterized membrane protein YeaQ/YmgE (transglycosylase-associated protein family)
MSLSEFIILLIIAGIIGTVAKAVTGFTRGGCILSIVVGFVGAIAGIWLAKQLKLPDLYVIHTGDVSIPVVWAVVGAIAFTSLLNSINPK